MQTKLDLKDIQQFLIEAKKDYDRLCKAEAEGKDEKAEDKKEEGKEELKKEEDKPAPKAEDSTPDAGAKQDEHMKQELEEEMNHVSVDDLIPAYVQMDEDDLMAHLIAVNQAFAAKMQMEQAAEEKQQEQVVDKAMVEKKTKQAINLLKSINKPNKTMEPKVTEKEAELTKEVKSLKSQLDTLVKSVEKLTSKGQSHALNGTNYLAKSENAAPQTKEYTYEELQKKLGEKAKSRNLSAEDRKKITKYTLNLELTDELKQFLDLK